MSADAADENLGVMDVMGVGKAKIKYNLQSKTYKDYPANEPEEVYFANRAQMNQVEQMASYMATWYDCMSWKGHTYMGVSLNGGTPKSSILIGFSIRNHPFWGTTIFGNIHVFLSRSWGVDMLRYSKRWDLRT